MLQEVLTIIRNITINIFILVSVFLLLPLSLSSIIVFITNVITSVTFINSFLRHIELGTSEKHLQNGPRFSELDGRLIWHMLCTHLRLNVPLSRNTSLVGLGLV